MESSFYFDEKTQTWVDGSAPASESSAAGTPLGAPPIAPMASTGAVVAREDSNDGSPSAAASVSGSDAGPPTVGSPRATAGLRSRYVDVFARDGLTTAPTTAPAANVSAFVPSATPIGGFGGATAPTAGAGMQFFVPAPRAAEEGDKDERERLMEPLALMQQPATSEPEDETVKTDDVVTGADAASAGAIESTEDATKTPSAGVDANAFGDETPAEFGGGDDGAPEMGVYDDWATTETSGGGDAIDGGRWDASRVDPMTTETESAAAAAFPVVSDERVETATPSTVDHVDAQTHEDQYQWTEEQQWDGYEGHEDYEYDPRWKYDDDAGEWYWDGGDDDDWIERSAHDAAVAELRSALDAKTEELEEASATRETLMEELREARETREEMRARLEENVSATPAVNEIAVDEAYARGKEDGYREGYAIGSAEAREELEDLLVCLGQEGRRVEKLREMLAETGADMDAVIAEFELEEEEEMARLVAKETEIVDDERVVEEDVHVREEDVVEEEDAALPEISQSLRAMAAEIDTPERVRDYPVSSLDPVAEEFILPTPPKASKHDASERNLAAAFELA